MNFKEKDKELLAYITEIDKKVYEATALFEELEKSEKIIGNGHHLRQMVGNFAKDLLEARWHSKTE